MSNQRRKSSGVSGPARSIERARPPRARPCSSSRSMPRDEHAPTPGRRRRRVGLGEEQAVEERPRRRARRASRWPRATSAATAAAVPVPRAPRAKPVVSGGEQPDGVAADRAERRHGDRRRRRARGARRGGRLGGGGVCRSRCSATATGWRCAARRPSGGGARDRQRAPGARGGRAARAPRVTSPRRGARPACCGAGQVGEDRRSPPGRRPRRARDREESSRPALSASRCPLCPCRLTPHRELFNHGVRPPRSPLAGP